MLGFKPVRLENKEEIKYYLKMANSSFCDLCFVDMFIWKDQFNTQFCIKDGYLFLKAESFPDRTPIYISPVGEGNFIKSVRYIFEDARERRIPLIITCLSDEQKDELKRSFPEQILIEELRNSADYLYRSEDLISLKGNKFHSKKNHINHFKKTYENRWKYEEIRLENIREVMDYYRKWQKQNEDKKQSLLQGEERAIQLAFEHFTELNLRGGLLRLDGNVIAFTLGAQSTDDMFVIQIEKADSHISGAYQMINQQFAETNCQDVLWINREEDLGIEGLRKSKLSYHPASLKMKYTAKLKTGVEKNVHPIC
jgi:hypothetical protein